ncbi:MAG: SRPBCC family protein [Nitrospinota bacterium]
MVPVVVLQQIKAPVDRVFNFIANLETHPQIASFCQSVKYTSERRQGVGATFHQFYKNGGECDSEIIVWEPPTKIVWQNFYGAAKKPGQTVTYYLEQEGEITHVLHTVERTDDREGDVDLAHHREGTAENVEEMANLKKILES